MDRNDSAPAIVIRSGRRGERDRLLTLLSPVWGIRHIIVYGAQKSRRAVRASLYTEGVFHIYDNRERHQASLVDVDVITIHENALSSLAASFSSTLMCEIVMDHRGTEAPAFYDLLVDCLDVIDEENHKRVVVQFIIRALEIAGLSSGYEVCPVCGRRYSDDEVLGFSDQLASPCCRSCASMSVDLVLPPNARRYVRDSLGVGFARSMQFSISDLMATRLMRYAIRLYRLSCSSPLRSAVALMELDGLA